MAIAYSTRQPTIFRNWKPYDINQLTHLVSPNLNLLSQDQFFGLAGSPNFDWPNPPLAKPPSISLKTWINPLQQQLISKDQFFGLIGNPNFDWPVPKGFIPNIDLKTWIHNPQQQLTLFPIPLNQFDWPNPKGYIPNIALKSWIKYYIQAPPIPATDVTRYITRDPLIFRNWLNPNLELRNYIQPSNLKLLIVINPTIAQLDWPVPKGATPGIILKNYTQSIPATLAQFYVFGPAQFSPNSSFQPFITLNTNLPAYVYNNLTYMQVVNSFNVQLPLSNSLIVFINKTIGSPTTVVLATPFLTPSPPTNPQRVFIKDAKGDAATNPIKVVGLIDGVYNRLINTNNGSLSVRWNGTQWNQFDWDILTH